MFGVVSASSDGEKTLCSRCRCDTHEPYLAYSDGSDCRESKKELPRAGDFRKGRLDKISKLADFQSWVPKPHNHMRNLFVMLTFAFGIATMRNKSIDCDILASGLEIAQRVITFFEKKTNQTVSRYNFTRYRAGQDGSRENQHRTGCTPVHS